ncbi:MAG: NAD-dependent epimerase/dehydratase family protein [Firmicutes bacterium]|nr:NAD-dependent epimerase/dehydratase family protein [Bacillota bacterium]
MDPEKKVLVTGGAGFIGRWVVKRLLERGHRVAAFDNLSNGRMVNLEEFRDNPRFSFTAGDIKDVEALGGLFSGGFDLVLHLAASINVQDSIDDPRTTFDNDVIGTFNVLEQCRRRGIKTLFMSTCMVYDRCLDARGISEAHPTRPASPYAASKLAGEMLTLSYYHAYGLPTVVVRPFNTYGPFQKSSGEGGVVAIFIQRWLAGEVLDIYGDGTQTRDLLYVEDCADFVIEAGFSEQADGEILNAGLGRDRSINELAVQIAGDPGRIRHVPHIHPQSEIMKLLCCSEKAERMLNWRPSISLEEGLRRTQAWIEEQMKHG